MDVDANSATLIRPLANLSVDAKEGGKMAKLSQSFAKYLIHARFETNGIVERPDVIGAIFGQTEGLLGEDLDLRELQKTGRIGRIEVIVRKRNGRCEGTILVPSSLDMSETALIAAALETIEKIGPCDAKITVTKVEDVRAQKRRYVVERAKEILKELVEITSEETRGLSEIIKEAVRAYEITSYRGLSCGPDVETSDEIIVVEGRADVINLLKHGIKNCIAIEGANIPKPIVDLSQEKITTAFVDGDRGGELVLKKLLSVADIDYVARAPEGKEVEELSKKEIFKALRERVPADQVKKELESGLQESVVSYVSDKRDDVEKVMRDKLKELIGSRAALLFDENMKVIAKVPLSELVVTLSEFPNTKAIAIDGEVTQAIVDLALSRRIKLVGGTSVAPHLKRNGLRIISL